MTDIVQVKKKKLFDDEDAQQNQAKVHTNTNMKKGAVMINNGVAEVSDSENSKMEE